MWGIIAIFWENEFIHAHPLRKGDLKYNMCLLLKWMNKDTLNGDSLTIIDMSLKCKIIKE